MPQAPQLTDEQERKIARVEKRIRNSDYGSPTEHWIKESKARPAPASAVRFRKGGSTMRVGHRHKREAGGVEGRWVVIQSLWMVPRVGVVAWVCFPLLRTNRHTWMFAGAFVDAEFEPDETGADSSP